MSAVQEIIAKWPTPSEMARDLGLIRISHGHLMKVRMSIGVSHWPRLIEAAKRRKIKGVTYEALVEAHAADAPLREALRKQRGVGSIPKSPVVRPSEARA